MELVVAPSSPSHWSPPRICSAPQPASDPAALQALEPSRATSASCIELGRLAHADGAAPDVQRGREASVLQLPRRRRASAASWARRSARWPR